MSFYEVIAILFICVLLLIDFPLRIRARHKNYKKYKTHFPILILWHELALRHQSKESFDALTHVHTKHWEYIQSILSWRQRLSLSRFRGKKWALKLLIKPICLFRGIDPEVAQWILDEYMITTKVEDLPPPENTWVCPHCGTANINTALFCKDCGEYK